MTDADTATLYVDGRCTSQGPLKQATDIIHRLGFRPGDEYTMVMPTGTQVTVRLRTPEERANGVSAIARRLPKDEPET